jgi:hypothetical protein
MRRRANQFVALDEPDISPLRPEYTDALATDQVQHCVPVELGADRQT